MKLKLVGLSTVTPMGRSKPVVSLGGKGRYSGWYYGCIFSIL